MRADAQRNRDALVAAARAEFAEHGPGAPLDDVARRAGLGNATLYRHFPTRDELVVAVYAEEVTELCLLDGPADDPATALFDWLAEFRRHVAAKRDLASALAAGERRAALFEQWHRAMHDTAGTLLARAQRCGAVTAATSVADLLTVVNGIALAGADDDQAARLLAVVRAGLAG